MFGDAQYDFPLSGLAGGFVGASVVYHSRSNAQFGNNPLFGLPAYTIVDVRAGVTGDRDRWRVELFGRNVTNEYYWTNVALAGDAVVRYAAFPVTYGIRLAVKFR